MNATPERLDLARVIAALAAINKTAPDLAPAHSCRGGELDIEVPDQDTAARITRLLGDIRHVRGTHLYSHGWGGTIAGCPVRILVTVERWQRGRWVA